MLEYQKYRKYDTYQKFLESYRKAENAATGSKYDSNANVVNKNVCSFAGEMYKKEGIGFNRYRRSRKINELYGRKEAESYLKHIKNHVIYPHDETNPVCPYCVSVSMMPFLWHGLKQLGGISSAPKNLRSFCGSFINLIFILSSQFAGACLDGEQELLVQKEGVNYSVPIKELVSSYCLDRKIINEKDWEVGIVGDNLKVWENGKYVKVNKVYRRKYTDKIYKIRTKTGKEIKCSKDHKFQVLRSGRLMEVKADELVLFDTVVNTMSDFRVNKNGEEYRKGQLLGGIVGDSSLTDNNKEASISKYSLDFLMGFLDGVLLADGHFSDEDISLTSVNKNLIDDVVNIVYKVGINSEIKEDGYGDRQKLYTVKLPIKTAVYLKDALRTQTGDSKHLKDLSDGIVSKGCRNIEIGYVGNSYSPHKKNEKDVQPVSDIHWSRNFVPDAIVEIDSFENKDRYVYEIETETHWYSAGGVLTHNCATPEFLTYFDYFARKEYGDNYTNELDRVVFYGAYERTIKQELDGFFQQVIYSINQPAAARNFQSVFWNISYFDKYYFEKLFEGFVFPDMTRPNFESVKNLQFIFMEWFRDERIKQEFTLTFPVENACFVDDGVGKFLDEDTFLKLMDIWATGHETFFYHSDTVDSLASCCRLKNGFSDNTFSTSLGVGGIATGSKGVISINFNREVQLIYRKMSRKDRKAVRSGDYRPFEKDLRILLDHMHKWLTAWNEVLKEQLDLMPVYQAKFITLEKQYLTIGINGFLESAEFLGIDITNSDGKYEEYASFMFGIIKDTNTQARTDELMFNTELVPAENLGVKHARWDREDGFVVPREIYNSYFYPVESDMNMYDRMKLQGNGFTRNLDGGSAFHNNLSEPLTAKQYQIICEASIKERCDNMAINVPSSICCDCGKKIKGYYKTCPVCGSKKIDYEDRIIGYLKRVSKWSTNRQKEYGRRRFFNPFKKGLK